MVQKTDAVDLIKTEVIFNGIMGVAEEIGKTLIRTSYSPNIKQRADCSTAILNASGEVIAQAPMIPLHLGSMMGTVKCLLNYYPFDQLKPGDMFISNDPYAGDGQHLPDLNIVAPFFYDGVCQGFTANIAHHSDVGGMVPGSESIVCQNIYQEGLRIPPVRIVHSGEVNQDIINMIMLNSRAPQERYGDLMAQIAANKIGVARMREIYDKYGVKVVNLAANTYLDATERRFHAVLESISDGVYYAEDYLDPDIFSDNRSVKIALKLTKKKDKLIFDFNGTDKQLNSSRNVSPGALNSTVYCVVKSLLDPDLASNSGYFRAIEIEASKGSVLNPNIGAAVGSRSLTCAVVGDVIAQALSKALPARELAGSGPHHQITFSGVHNDSKMWVNYETIAGGSGARPYRNGMDAVRIHASGASNLPIESLENVYPVLVERYELRSGSGGKGLFRGGDGVRRDYRVLTDHVTVSVSAERQSVNPKGLKDGGDGLLGEFVINPGKIDEKKLSSAVAEYRLNKGDVLSVRTPGGAGYGLEIEKTN
jgi:N-methylhydantoinase B